MASYLFNSLLGLGLVAKRGGQINFLIDLTKLGGL